MRLRICDGERERIVPASFEAVEQAFAPGAHLRRVTEITVTDGVRWLAALSLGAPDGSAEGEVEEFLLTGVAGESVAVTARVDRSEAFRRFRDFVLGSGTR
jgi:hypothetical protein